MAPSSKLDYLSKYLEDPKGKKKKKKKRRRRDREHDDHKDTDLPPPPMDNEDQLESDDDAPVVVATVDESARRSSVSNGKWEDVVDNKAVVKSEDTNSSRRRGSARTRHQRHDSPSSSSKESEPRRSGSKRRHDSSSDEESEASVGRSNSSSSTRNSDRRKRRYDTDSDGTVNAEEGNSKRNRHDSSDDEDHNDSDDKKDSGRVARRIERHDSWSSSDDGNGQRMSSGHHAGLQTGSKFAVKEAEIQSRRHREATEMVKKYGVGETVYRSKKGEKSKSKNGDRIPLTAEEKKRLQTGRAQIEREEQAKREFAAIQQSAFARFADDDTLEEHRKQELRAGDPMAAFMRKQRPGTANTNEQAAASARPVYKGPPPRPNRFGIPPGYRWDAHDRGNGFEDRLLAKRASAQNDRERSYRYSAADM